MVREFAQGQLHLHTQAVGDLYGFLCLEAGLAHDVRTLQLLLLYAVYSAISLLRFSEGMQPLQAIQELLLQFVHQGAGQSSDAQRVISDGPAG